MKALFCIAPRQATVGLRFDGRIRLLFERAIGKQNPVQVIDFVLKNNRRKPFEPVPRGRDHPW